jgi:tetratricopeptide (TPR) repeat protein
MPPSIQPGVLDRLARFILASTLLLAPLAHSGTFADPFALPKWIVMTTAALLLAGTAIASHLFEDGASRIGSLPLWFAAAFVVCAALAVVPSLNRGLALGGLLEIAAGAGLFWGVTRFVRGLPAIARLLAAILIAAAVVALGSIVQVFFQGFHLSPWGISILPPSKGGSTLGDAGLAAQFLIVTLPAGIGAAALCSGGRRVACGALLGVVVSALLFAGRPEAWVVAAATLCLLAALRILQVAWRGGQWSELAPGLGGDSLRAFIAAAIVVLAVVALSRWSFLYPTGKPAEPLEGVSLLTPTSGDAALDRAAAIPGTFALVGRHPFGVGPGNWRHAFLEVAWTRAKSSPFTLSHQAVHAGNDFVETTAETGVLGGVVFAVMIVILMVQSGLVAVRAPAGWAAAGYAMLGVLAALCLEAFFGAPFQEPVPSLVLWVTAGLIQVTLLETPVVGGVLGRLLSRETSFLPLALRSRRTGFVLAAVWVAASGALALYLWDRVLASRWALSGQAAFYGGRYEEALLAFGQPASRRSPEHLPRLLAGNAYLRLGFHDFAAKEFGEALARSPHFLAAYLGRAAARQSQGRYDLAEEDLKSALQIWPDNADTYIALGRLDTTRGRLDAALKDYEAVLRINRELAEPFFRMGEIFMRRGELDDAIEAFRICGIKSPLYPKLQLTLGDAFFRKGLHEMALRTYQAAVGTDEKSVDARLRVAGAHHALDQFCEAQDALEAARDLETDTERRGAILDLLKTEETACQKQKSGSPKGRR